MLKFQDIDITISKIPDELSLCIGISNCPFDCKGCLSPQYREDKGASLTEDVLDLLIEGNKGISAVCF